MVFKKSFILKLMIVVSIVTIILYVFYPIFDLSHITLSHNKRDIRFTIQSLAGAVRIYYTDYGFYPSDGSKDRKMRYYSDTALFEYLSGELNSPSSPKMYYEFDKNRVKNNRYVDKIWGRPYLYRNLEEDGIEKKTFNRDPRLADIKIKSFQIYHDFNEEDPSKWFTNYDYEYELEKYQYKKE